MKKFIVIYHAPISAQEQTSNMSPQEQAKGMEGWMMWAKQCGDKLVDMGMPLTSAQLLSPDGGSKPGDNTVTGYSILQANNMNEAKALLKGHPHLGWNAACSIEVHEAMPLPGMQ